MTDTTGSPDSATVADEPETPTESLDTEDKSTETDPLTNHRFDVSKVSDGAGEKVVPPEVEDSVPVPVVVKPPDGGWGWVVVAASFMCNFLVDGMLYSFGVFLTDMESSLGASTTQITLVGSLLSGFYLLAGPFISALANKFGFRAVTILGSVVTAIGFVSASYAESIYELYFFFGLVGGLGFGLIYSPSILIVGFYFERWRALATGIAVCGSGIGMLVFSPLSTALIESLGWRATVRVHAAMILICVFCGLLFRPLKPLQLELEEVDRDLGHSKKKIKKSGRPPTAAEVMQLSKSTQSLTPSILMTRVAALSGHTNNSHTLPAIPGKKRDRTTSENSSNGGDRSRRGTVTEYVARSRRGTLSRGDDVTHINRPLYRDDIFFGGSLHRLPDYKSSQKDFMGYTLSVTRLPTKKELDEEKRCTVFPEAIKRALATLFDTSLLKSPSFLMLSISGFLTLMGVFTPCMYMQDRALGGMSKEEAAWLLSAVGVTNTIGRVICGILSSCPSMDALLINNVAITLGGIATMASSISLSAAYQFSFCAIFGFTLACFASLRAIIVVDLVGIGKLTNAFGILLLFQGVGAFMGSPLAGYIKEATNSYEYSFMVAGGFILLSGILCYPLKAISKWEERKRKEETDDAFV